MMNAERRKTGRKNSFIIYHSSFIVLTFLAMLVWTWGTWPDPIIDFGRELYVPWQILAGRVLYRDIAYFNGPLSAYFNALVFAVLGVSLRSIVIANLLILAGVAWMIWRLWARIADQLTATLACVVLLTVFAFIQLGGVGNYNFITPYSHEITHGLALSLGAICCLAGYLEKSALWRLASAGLFLGLVFLTKAEVFLAAAVAISAALLLCRPAPRAILVFACALVVPPAVAFMLLWLAMPAAEALRSTLGSWMYVFDSRVTGLVFYRRILGTLDVAQSLRMILTCSLCYAAVVAAAILAGRRLRGWSAATVVLVIAIAVVAVMFSAADMSIWQQSLRALSLVSPAIAVCTLVAAVRDRQMILRAVVSIFAATLLAKMALNVLAYHYGFALAMPATLVTIAATANWLPATVERRGGFGWSSRAVVLPVVGLFVFVHLYVYSVMFRPKQVRVGQGADAFYADLRGRAVNLMLQSLAQLPADATLAVVPEGVMINYLSRRTNPTPFVNLMPPEVLMFGQQRVIQAFARHPPDYLVVVLASSAEEYGYRGFAEDYGADIYRWIQANYQQVPAPQEPAYPLLLMRRR